MSGAAFPDPGGVGFPIVEASPDGTFVITKHERTGGWVMIPSVKEQLVYEMGDPHEYITPDCVADFTTVRLEYEGRDRVRVYGIEGQPATEISKVSISYSAGYKAVGTLVYSWPDAYDKAQAADRILRARLDRLGLKFDQILTEFVGANATHGPLAGQPSPDITGSAIARGRSQRRPCGGREIHERDCAIGTDRPTRRHRICGWQTEGRRDCGVLAGTDSERGDSSSSVGN